MEDATRRVIWVWRITHSRNSTKRWILREETSQIKASNSKIIRMRQGKGIMPKDGGSMIRFVEKRLA